MRKTHLLTGALAVSALAAAGAGATPPAPVQVAEHLVVTPLGAHVEQQFSRNGNILLSRDMSSGSIQEVTGTRWTLADGGLAWIPSTVDVGDDGACVVAGLGLNNQATSLFPTGSSTGVWNVPMAESEGPFVAMADRAGLSGSMQVVDMNPDPNVFDYQATAYIYSNTGNGTPLWSYVYPNTANYFGGGVAISDDGSVVLTWKDDPNIGQLRVNAFQSDGTPISSAQISSGGFFDSRQTRLSDDGSRAYFNIGTDAVIYDVASATVLNTTSIGASFDSHAFSGDGKTFAFGNFGVFNVYRETTPGIWTQVASKSFPGGTYVAYMDLNQDGSRLGYEVQNYLAFDNITVGMFDVNTSNTRFEHTYTATGTPLQLACSGCQVDDNGDYVAGSSWGDAFNTTPEAFVFDKDGNATAEIDARGSVFAMSMDADGDVVAIGNKSTHANNFGSGGDVSTFDAYDQTLHVLGYPQVGQPITIAVPRLGNRAVIAVCSQLGHSNSPYGQTELNLSTLLQQIGPVSIPNNGLMLNVNIPNSQQVAGKVVHLQGVILGGSQPILTNKVSVRVQP